MLLVIQNSAKPFNIYFGTSGLTVTATLSKNGGSPNAVAPSYTNQGNGYYSVTPLAAHRDTIGENAWLFSAAGQPSLPRVEQVGLADVDVVAVGANTVAPDNAGIAANGVAISALPVPPTAAAISIQIATDWDAGLNSWGDGLNALVDSYITPTLPSAVKHALFAANSQDLKISLSAGGNSYTPDSVIVDVRSIADQVISEDGAVKFKLFFGDDETYGAAKRLVDMTAGTFDEATFKAQAFIASGLATNVKIVEEANRVIDEIPETGLGGI